MANEERRSQFRREDDRASNGWKEHQKLVMQTLKDLKAGQKELREAVHATPCPTVKSMNTKIDTGIRVIRWFVTPIVVALIGGAIALLFKVFSSGGVQ